MKMQKYSSFKALLLLTVVGLGSGCEKSSEFFEKADLETSNIGRDNGNSPIDDGSIDSPVPPVKDPVCVNNPDACDLTSVTSKPGVVTMLLAFGDLLGDKVVITEGSARLLAQNSVKYASPVEQPKILVVKDYNNNGESPYDTEYIAKVLLSNYNKVDVLNETSSGLKASDLEGYDLVWYNNPGHPMGNVVTRRALLNFKGGVILSGDDLTRGPGFELSELTGLKYLDNGVSVSCNGQTYVYDNNYTHGYRYQIEISAQFFPGITNELRLFEYGNDIDRSVVIDESKVEVLASASDKCNGKRPVIVRYEKSSVGP